MGNISPWSSQRWETCCHEEAKEIWEWILIYRFLWVVVGLSGSSSDAQIFNWSKLRKKIEDGTFGLPPAEPLGEGGPNLHYFLLGDDAFALMPWKVKPYSRRQLTKEERITRGRGCWRLFLHTFRLVCCCNRLVGFCLRLVVMCSWLALLRCYRLKIWRLSFFMGSYQVMSVMFTTGLSGGGVQVLNNDRSGSASKQDSYSIGQDGKCVQQAIETQDGFQVGRAKVRIQSQWGGSVRYQTCLIFCWSTATHWETTTNPNRICKHCSRPSKNPWLLTNGPSGSPTLVSNVYTM